MHDSIFPQLANAARTGILRQQSSRKKNCLFTLENIQSELDIVFFIVSLHPVAVNFFCRLLLLLPSPRDKIRENVFFFRVHIFEENNKFLPWAECEVRIKIKLKKFTWTTKKGAKKLVDLSLSHSRCESFFLIKALFHHFYKSAFV